MVAQKGKGSSWFSKLFEPRIDFFALLRAHSAKTLEGMEALEQWIAAGAGERCQRVRDLEGEADQLKLEIEKKLVDAFVTPFDREDIYDLALRLDEVINGGKGIVREMEALDIRGAGPVFDDFIEMSGTLVEGTRSLHSAFSALNANLTESSEHAAMARKSENRFAKLYRVAMRELFEYDDFKFILKTREVYRAMQLTSERIDIVGEKLLHAIVKMN